MGKNDYVYLLCTLYRTEDNPISIHKTEVGARKEILKYFSSDDIYTKKQIANRKGFESLKDFENFLLNNNNYDEELGYFILCRPLYD